MKKFEFLHRVSSPDSEAKDGIYFSRLIAQDIIEAMNEADFRELCEDMAAPMKLDKWTFAPKANHEVWVTCPVCTREYDARSGRCECGYLHAQLKDRHPVTMERLDGE